MSELEFDIRKPPGWERGAPHQVSMSVYGRLLTRLVRNDGREFDGPLADPDRLAFWLLDNWWRLRWETLPLKGHSDHEWRMAHDLAAIGGAVWPRVSMWSEGKRIGVMSRADPPETLAPVRYLQDALVYMSSESWEMAIDRFFDTAIECSADKAALTAGVQRLHEERTDNQVSKWRRIEAKLGYDTDEAPEAVMDEISSFFRQYQPADVEEALQASARGTAARTLRLELKAAGSSAVVIRPSDAVVAAGSIDWHPQTSPWQAAEDAAARLRGKLGIGFAPVLNGLLADILRISKSLIPMPEGIWPSHSFGLRVSAGDGAQKISLRSRATYDRRFELARAIGDLVWARGSRLGVTASTKTDRQRFQRAFAQSLLCPFDALMSYLQTHEPNDENLEAAAEHFHVNIKVIKTTLVNKRVLSPDSLEEGIEAA